MFGEYIRHCAGVLLSLPPRQVGMKHMSLVTNAKYALSKFKHRVLNTPNAWRQRKQFLPDPYTRQSGQLHPLRYAEEEAARCSGASLAAEIRFTREELDHVYGPKYMRHFFSDEEIAAARERWSVCPATLLASATGEAEPICHSHTDVPFGRAHRVGRMVRGQRRKFVVQMFSTACLIGHPHVHVKVSVRHFIAQPNPQSYWEQDISVVQSRGWLVRAFERTGSDDKVDLFLPITHPQHRTSIPRRT